MRIEFQNVDFAYGVGTPFEIQSLHEVNLVIPDGSFTAFIGHTGSGKSTAIKHLNGLNKPSKGLVKLDDDVITASTKGEILRRVRRKVGMVFQFPESQLFEETVIKDVMFGPKNYGASEEEAEEKATKALKLVGIEESIYKKSPFDLSGGQMRRVAIAGILAMEPEVLVLDEPTAGLDPQGHREMMAMFYDLYQKHHLTVVLVTHQMNDVAKYANHVIVMAKGTVAKEGSPTEIFKDPAWLKEHSLGLPDALSFKEKLEQQAGFSLPGNPLTLETLADSIQAYFKRGMKDEE
ncbi:energy-coupling factor ABC transporter ATP-binding protein [Aerococcus christensenii]|uniref:energy-coupling factor ABC transporter ATP-binding protein n=1 Tax=Aerococcus christensenii TaxID=87541 RepID=UPI0007630221|nr:energy-coupling factor ABC transporter ATP-binding protein [Aerococcus christensenii]AMB92622.1 energy-coupling factor transporter ATPase [Aerococcus christensenii]MDK8233833.1 energy-coupling factor ABC transporter ATP-binding protein [Aerococcus christensenii]